MKNGLLTSKEEKKALYKTMGLSFKEKEKSTRFKRQLKCVIADIYSNFGQAKRKPRIPAYTITDIKTDRALGLLLKHIESCPVQDSIYGASTGTAFTFTTSNAFSQPKVKPLLATDKEKQEPKYPSGKWLFRLLESCGWVVLEFRPRHDGIEFIVRKLEAVDFEK